MKPSALSFCLLLAASAPVVAEPLPPWSEAAVKQWWKSRPAEPNWTAEGEKMNASLREMQTTAGLEKAAAAAPFLGWLELACWLSLAGDGKSDPAASWFATKEGAAAFAAVGEDAALRRLFLGSLSPFDEASKAAEILCRIRLQHPDLVAKYPKVAVAFALVWDQPFPEQWPHLWVNKNMCAMGDSDPARRFLWFTKVHAAKKFLLDPNRLDVRELMYVIDTPLELRELEYVLQISLKDPKRLSDLFQQVPYDSGRMQRGELIWNGSYRLIDIGKKGGICADQAFFVAQTGKAQGLPTVLFIGQGSSGGHAWVGYMGEAGRWNLEVARYKEHNYVAGSAWDPHTWRPVTDAQIRFLFKEPGSGPHVLRGRLLMRWAQMNKSADFYPRLLGVARDAWPRNFDIWDMQAAALEELNLPAEQRKAVWMRWIDTFKEDRDMRFQGQVKLLQLFESAGDITSADKLRAQIIADNKAGRFDLAIKLAAANVLELAGAGKWDEAKAAFGKVVAQFSKTAGGDLFYGLVQPYIDKALQAGRKDLAQAAYDSTHALFKAQELSTLAVDLKALSQLMQN